MATLSTPVGYECEFVDQVPEDYFCKQCKHVAREPNITTCCGETYCKACIEAVIQDKKPCPICENSELSTMGLHKKYQARILALKVCCSMKGRGCEWTGQLQHLDAHLHLTTGDCVYVDVDCPSKCNQKVQKRNVKAHLANECLEREHVCRFCGFTATFREVDQHLKTCELYILDCPNRCGVSFERNILEDHMKMCSLQQIKCKFNHTGCEAEFLRSQLSDHLEQNTQKHLTLLAATLKEQNQIHKKNLQEQQQENDTQIKLLQKEVIKLQNEVRQKDDKIEELRREIEITSLQLLPLFNQLKSNSDIPPYNITFVDYYQVMKGVSSSFCSPPMYTHPGGYRFKLTLWPNGRGDGYGTHVTVRAFFEKGEYDNKLKFPAKFTVTLELLNQHRNQDHYTRHIRCTASKERLDTGLGGYWKFIPHADLEWNADKQTQYLKNDCLKFIVKKVVVQ